VVANDLQLVEACARAAYSEVPARRPGDGHVPPVAGRPLMVGAVDE
jgi:hypothetical protein